jgi:hypothetical protein
MRLKINFTDFWLGFNKTDNFFWNLLSRHYELELSEQPDVLLFSVFGDEFKEHKCLRIFYTGECIEPDLRDADLSLSFSFKEDKRHYRFPLYAMRIDINQLLQKPDPAVILKEKTKFCSFVVSNGGSKQRNQFFHKLSEYKKVDSGGRLFNNIGGPVADKMTFIKDYKFVISFENERRKGYTTEKIVEPMLVNSIPIYWGDPLISKDFNPKSFINVPDFKNFDEVIKQLIRIDRDDELYCSYLSQPWLNNNTVNMNYLHSALLEKLIDLIDNRHTINLAVDNKTSSIHNIADRLKRKLRGERKFY